MITDPQELQGAGEEDRSGAADRWSDLVRMGEILDLAPIAMILREHGSDRILYWNGGAQALYGWTAEEALGQVTHTLLQTEFPTNQQTVSESLQTSGHWTGELVHTGRHGQRLVVGSQHVVRRDTNAQPVAILELNTDLTDRKELEQDLSESEDRFRLLVDNVQDYAIFLLSPDGRVLSWNAGAERLKGWRRDEIMGQPITRFYPPEDVEAGLPAALLARAETTGRAQHEGWRVRKDGSRFWADVVLTALRDPAGRLRGFAKITRDLTERKEAEAALNAALTDATAQLQRGLETRDEFLATVSHDLKNPIAAIQGISQLAQRRVRRADSIDRARLLADLEHIDEVANRTTLQVDELLDVARMQMDRPLDLDRSPTDLVALVRRAVGEHQQQTNRHTLTVDTDVPDLFGDWDPLRLSRALDQLLENAIKYSPNGGAIEVSVKRTNARGGAAEISVGDQGIGIPSDETDRIFDRFQRGSNAANRIAGTGLGLAGTRYIVESHGGTIRAHNRPGGGARFSIVLPLTSTPLAPDSST